MDNERTETKMPFESDIILTVHGRCGGEAEEKTSRGSGDRKRKDMVAGVRR